ncbi:MAG TPA: assimilatory sulfite reductase (NADPH) hemoprotein subunit [Steroidobacteraceae bacterium]|jgi:sulfite reductase (NADPH) hemoprotein beta-component|nr:assimilatory sulfite reductase (NADPH) hemoprotein subunit [Steroidobacteraceae bacterium]
MSTEVLERPPYNLVTKGPTQPESAVEIIKKASRGLRGTLVESLADPLTGAIRDSDTQLIKFHGSYMQDDRDIRAEREHQKLEPAYSFMIRTRLPGGVVTPKQWLALSKIARDYGVGSLRLTTRQAFQLHGVIKKHVKQTMQAMNAVLIDSVSACGDVNRNVMASANPVESQLHAEVHEWARKVSEHLKPRTRAYHEIWLDGEKLVGPAEEEPLYGPVYLPRKFKTAIVVPPHNDVDVFSQDLGYIAILDEQSKAVLGFNLTVGGGLGASHGEPNTFPRVADVIGFLKPEQIYKVSETVLMIQRDYGDRSDRKHARLKYTIADRGVDWFKGELFKRLGFELEPPRAFKFTTQGDRFGWLKGHDGNWHLTLRIESGRVTDTPGAPFLTGLEKIAAIHKGDFRLTPNQNLIIANVPPSELMAIDALVNDHGLGKALHTSPVRRDALACVALPTCALAMAESERYLPSFVDRVDELLHKHGLRGIPLTVRITGCPNGCARPYLAEIALIGRAPGRYTLRLGGDAVGSRLNVIYRDNIDEPSIVTALDELIGRYAAERQAEERFGDFLWRVQVLAPGTRA